MPNRIKKLSRSDINLFSFGSLQWVGKGDQAASQRLNQTCLEDCINHLDTAYAYREGTSKKFLGVFCKKEREEFLIATKVGHVGGASKLNILTQFDRCQTRLKVDVVDVLYLCRFDPETPIEERLETFAVLKKSRKIHHVGISNFSASQGMDSVHRSMAFGLTVNFFQPTYNLVELRVGVEILSLYAANGINVYTYNPLVKGLLKGKYLCSEQARLVEGDCCALRCEPAFMRDSTKILSDFADALQANPATREVAWVHAHPTKPMPIISASGVDQLVPSIEAMTYPLSEALYHQISALSPTPITATDRIAEA